jgi:hypothetical protein
LPAMYFIVEKLAARCAPVEAQGTAPLPAE